MATKTLCRKAFLIVDDGVMLRAHLAEVVAECGYEVMEASNVAEALRVLEASSLNVEGVITDIKMPGTRSGVVLAQHVRWVWPHMKVVVISGARAPMEGELPHLVRFLAKPVSDAALASAILAPG